MDGVEIDIDGIQLLVLLDLTVSHLDSGSVEVNGKAVETNTGRQVFSQHYMRGVWCQFRVYEARINVILLVLMSAIRLSPSPTGLPHNGKEIGKEDVMHSFTVIRYAIRLTVTYPDPVLFTRNCVRKELLGGTLGGLDVFLPYVKNYVETFMGKSITTQEWKDHLYAYYRAHGTEDNVMALDSIDWNAWLFGEGLMLLDPMERFCITKTHIDFLGNAYGFASTPNYRVLPSGTVGPDLICCPKRTYLENKLAFHPIARKMIEKDFGLAVTVL
ncbi:hypothetical protein J3A83DRAFT_4401200 [Scleroderma citrinum]